MAERNSAHLSGKVEIPRDVANFEVDCGGKTVTLTNLGKSFWPDLGVTKRDMLQYYADVSGVLLPHLRDRAMVMKRYPNGVAGKFFFMKRTPEPHPEWLETCSIEHASGSVIAFPIVQDVASLLWVVNLGCIDLNPWYARCIDTNKPDFIHFDLDPVPPAGFAQVRQAALLLRRYLNDRKVDSYAKTSGSKGIHVYVPLRYGPLQKEVWRVAKKLAIDIAKQHPDILTSEYRIAKRPEGRVLVDYNQNAWGRTLASVYSLRPRATPTVSAPVTWAELEQQVSLEQFQMDCMAARIAEQGDLFAGVLGPNHCPLESLA